MLRSPVLALALAAAACTLAAPALAADPAPSSAPTAKDAGAIDGTVTAIDYRANVMTVQAGSRKLDVAILPSTSVHGRDDAFGTIADIKKGAKVKVLMSERGGSYSAQIVTLH